jgi:hypothetical protein
MSAACHTSCHARRVCRGHPCSVPARAGGKRNLTDVSAEATAVREMTEETGGARRAGGRTGACPAAGRAAEQPGPAVLGGGVAAGASAAVGLGTPPAACTAAAQTDALGCLILLYSHPLPVGAAGLLSGYHVGGQLQPVLWYPAGCYACYPHRLAGGDELPAQYQRLAARRLAMRAAAPPGFDDTQELAWVPLAEVLEGLCAPAPAPALPRLAAPAVQRGAEPTLQRGLRRSSSPLAIH